METDELWISRAMFSEIWECLVSKRKARKFKVDQDAIWERLGYGALGLRSDEYAKRHFARLPKVRLAKIRPVLFRVSDRAESSLGSDERTKRTEAATIETVRRSLSGQSVPKDASNGVAVKQRGIRGK